jgi:hypothetical protein
MFQVDVAGGKKSVNAAANGWRHSICAGFDITFSGSG